MSVLNDVLKNLDVQKAKQRSVIMGAREEQTQVLPWYVWGLLGFMLAAITLLSVQVVMLHTQRLDVPLDLYDDPFSPSIPSGSDLVAEGMKRPAPLQQTTSQSAILPAHSLEKAVSKEPSPASTDSQKIVSKTQSTQAQEAAITALKSGETEQVKQILPKTAPAMQHNLNLRLMLKESPEKVVPYLQSNTPDFMSNNELLALAAQAQQRAGEHKMAVIYYQRLIKRMPGEARWQAGLAISLDGLGQYNKAMRVYQSVLQSGALPGPLKRFVEYRLKKLESING